MRKLSKQCGESIHLGILSDHEVISIEAVETQSSLKPTIIVGNRAPLYCTSIGKALLAFFTESERKEKWLCVRFPQLRKLLWTGIKL
jgi:DNA-binding IclR family transcriptional regulator